MLIGMFVDSNIKKRRKLLAKSMAIKNVENCFLPVFLDVYEFVKYGWNIRFILETNC